MLPLYTNCLLKSDALAGGADLGCDDRALHMSTVSSMDVESSLVYFYPRLLALNPEETGLLDQVGCTMEKVRVNGVYLLENGLQPLLFAGIAAHPTWIQVLVTPRFTSLSSGNFLANIGRVDLIIFSSSSGYTEDNKVQEGNMREKQQLKDLGKQRVHNTKFSFTKPAAQPDTTHSRHY